VSNSSAGKKKKRTRTQARAGEELEQTFPGYADTDA